MKDLLHKNELFQSRCYVNGKWCSAEDQSTFNVVNPANGVILGTMPKMSGEDVRRSVDAADRALNNWSKMTAKERAELLGKWHDLILANREDLARLMTAEQGKPLAEARGEIDYAASFIDWFAEEGRRVYGDVIPPHQADKRILVLKQPVGVCAAITPWNFPAAMITRKAGPALAAGCTMIVKPASATPFSALALAKLSQEAGIPAGVFNVVTGKAQEVGDELIGNPTVRKLTFTGSTTTGKKLLVDSAKTLKKVTLELGGNAPFIIFDDADLDAAVEGALAAKYRNNGQTCICANRFLVQNGIYEKFTEKFVSKLSEMKVGDGMVEGTTLGPLINEDAVESIEQLLTDAISKGARVVVGGKRHSLGKTFFEPTLLTEVTPQMQLTQEEIFGPIAPLIRFSSEEEALELANATRAGLASYFYTRDLARSWRVSEALEYGMVGVNTGLISTAVAPFGGIKESGIGREGSRYGIEAYLEIKYVCVGEIHE